jgi:hypothetical protein
MKTLIEPVDEDTIVPSPNELVDEIVEHDKHPMHRHHLIIRSAIFILFYTCAALGVMWLLYLGWNKTRYFVEDYTRLQEKVAESAIVDKEVKDMEKTLSMAYDHLTVWESRYYAFIFKDFSNKYGIPWQAYAALVRYESNFNPTLTSDSGAVGMTQVMEKTGKSIANKLGIRYKEGETLWNDLYNMVIGFTYFSESYTDAINEGQTRNEALQHAMRHYVSGTGDPAKIKKKSKEAQAYIKEYKTSVWQEYKKLVMFHRGVQSGEPDSLILEILEN